MAIDFHEETYEKKYKAARLAYEAQLYVLSKFKKQNVSAIESPFKTVVSEPKQDEIDEAPVAPLIDVPMNNVPPPQDLVFEDPIEMPTGPIQFDMGDDLFMDEPMPMGNNNAFMNDPFRLSAQPSVNLDLGPLIQS